MIICQLGIISNQNKLKNKQQEIMNWDNWQWIIKKWVGNEEKWKVKNKK